MATGSYMTPIYSHSQMELYSTKEKCSTNFKFNSSGDIVIGQSVKTAQGNDKCRKQKEPKKKAAEPPFEEIDNDKCRHHKEIQKLIKMMKGRFSFLEHCIKSEKEFPDLTDDDALIGHLKEHDELSSLKEDKLDELALILPCPVLDFPENTNNSIKLNDSPETNVKKHSRQMSYDSKKIANPNTDGGFTSPKKLRKN
ncbi:hypothetical protein TNCV_3596611 [Trichonephila clavipes]|nr:hypothetical protein TNCV_3596611 [Trichonephila clavipes]